MKTATAERLHIGIFGPTNAGKSSLINALTLQDVALVSQTPGTTTDPVFKAMELQGVGPVVFIDTAGFNDEGELGEKRLERTRRILDRVDLAVLVMTDSVDEIAPWRDELAGRDIPTIIVLNKVDLKDRSLLLKAIKHQLGEDVLAISTRSGQGIDTLRERISALGVRADRFITEGLVEAGDVVVLVTPQDPAAPKGRLILPQVQVIRELLDRHCLTLVTNPEELAQALAGLTRPPSVIITDSQVFDRVYPLVPKETMLTSFSILFAGYKGDLDYFIDSAGAIDQLTPNSRVLIAEACTHAPIEEDIGTVKIPAMLRRRIGPELRIDFVRGSDFPQDVSSYDLIIQCGSCMVNRRQVLSRVAQAKAQGTPMTNYGVTLAKLQNILDRISRKRSS